MKFKEQWMWMKNWVVKIRKLGGCWIQMQIMCTASGSFKGGAVSPGGATAVSSDKEIHHNGSICCFLLRHFDPLDFFGATRMYIVRAWCNWVTLLLHELGGRSQKSSRMLFLLLLLLLLDFHNLTFKPNEDISLKYKAYTLWRHNDNLEWMSLLAFVNG